MTRYASILVATDFSPAAHRAVCRAAMLAERLACPLAMLHVMSPAGSPALRRLFARPIDLDLKRIQTRASLRRHAKELVGRHGIAVTFDVTVGDACEEILRAAERTDLVVLGHAAACRGHIGGGTADRLVRTCRKPLLVVKQATDDTPYRRILTPVDFTSYSQAALATAAAVSPDAAIHVFHARSMQREVELQMADVADPAMREILALEDGETRTRMQAMAAQAGLAPGRVSACVGHGDASRATLDQARALQADLIVAGKQGRSTLADFLLGSVTRRLMAHATCDVLVLPRAAAEACRPRSVAPLVRQASTRGGRDGAQQRLVWK